MREKCILFTIHTRANKSNYLKQNVYSYSLTNFHYKNILHNMGLFHSTCISLHNSYVTYGIFQSVNIGPLKRACYWFVSNRSLVNIYIRQVTS